MRIRGYISGVRSWLVVLWVLLFFSGVGCGGFAARRIAQAPNTYPKWLAPEAPVTIGFSASLLTLLTNGTVEIDSPRAKLFYRVLAPGDYGFRWTNVLDEARGELTLRFSAEAAGASSSMGGAGDGRMVGRGTVFVVHGYGVDGAAMLPWAFVLAEQGWRVVLVDLRGHGNSTGERVYFGAQEVSDLRAVLDRLGREGEVVHVVGHSFGAVLALKWKLEDARVGRVVAMAPYADLGEAIQNIRRQYARWIPTWFIAAGVQRLPKLLEVEECEMDPGCWVDGRLEDVLFVAGGADRIATLNQVRELVEGSGVDNRILIQPKAVHETLPFYLAELSGEVIEWLNAEQLEVSTNQARAAELRK